MNIFNDAFSAVAQRVFPGSPFTAWSGGLCLNRKLHERALLRVEGRQFYSPDRSLPDAQGMPASAAAWLVVSLAAWL